MIQVSRHSISTLAATLVASFAIGLAGMEASYATTGTSTSGLIHLAADVPADTPIAAPAANNTVAAPAETAPTTATDARDDAAVAAKATPDAAPATVASNDESSGWDRASFVGKICIACGTLLTLGSAARMFMA